MEGISLYKWAINTNHQLTELQAAEIVEKLSDAVQAIHDKGRVHCDLKPRNILGCVMETDMLDVSRLKIGDFGLARPAGIAKWGGTLPYMAPERLNNEAYPSCDIFGLGMILLFLINRNFGPHIEQKRHLTNIQQSLSDLARLGADQVPDSVREDYKEFIISLRAYLLAPSRETEGIGQPVLVQDGVLRTIVAKCLAVEPSNRYPSAADLRDDLAHWRKDQPTKDSDYNYTFAQRVNLFLRRCRRDGDDFEVDQAKLCSFAFTLTAPIALLLFGTASVFSIFFGYDTAFVGNIASDTLSVFGALLMIVLSVYFRAGRFVKKVAVIVVAWVIVANTLLILVIPPNDAIMISQVMAPIGALVCTFVWITYDKQWRLPWPALSMLVLAVFVAWIWPKYPEHTRPLSPLVFALMYFVLFLGLGRRQLITRDSPKRNSMGAERT